MVLQTIRTAFHFDFVPERTLDFGCGVGRLVIPFARAGSNVVGVDISRSMLAEARRNCEQLRLSNVELLHSDDGLSAVSGRFDLVHSCLVLQHIPPRRGRRIIGELIKRVRLGGFVVLQFYYRCNAPLVLRALVRACYAVPFANYARNLVRGRPVREPAMELHVYDLPRVLHCLASVGINDIHQVLGTGGNGDFDSVCIFGRRSADR
jgi:SAM-dependent methyltransferase